MMKLFEILFKAIILIVTAAFVFIGLTVLAAGVLRLFALMLVLIFFFAAC